MKRFASLGTLILITVAFVLACQPIAVTTPAPAGTAAVDNTPTPRPTDTPTPTATPSPTPTPRPTRTPTPATSSDLDEEPASLSGQAFEMTLTEQEVNELAQTALGTQQNVPISNPQIRLETGQIVASGRARVGFFAADVELTGIVPLENGKPAPEIVSIRLNGRPISGFLRTQIVNMIQPYLNQLAQADLAVDFEEFQITTNEIQIEGTYK